MSVSRDNVLASSGAATRSALRESVLRLRSINWPTTILVLVVGWMIARFVTTFSTYYIIAAMAAIGLGMALIRNLEFGLWGYLFVVVIAFGESPGIQSPNSGYKAGLMPSEILLAFIAMLWLGRAIFSRGFRLAPSEMNLPMVALGSVAILSLISSNLLRGTRTLLFHQLPITQVAEVGLLWLSIVAFFLAANTWNDRNWLERLFIPVVGYGLLIAFFKIIGRISPVPIAWGSFVMSAAIAFVYARLLFHENIRSRQVILAFMLLIMLYAISRSLSWISGCAAVGCVLLVITFYRSRALGSALLVVAIIAFFTVPGLYHGIRAESEEGGDFDRFTIWHDAFGMFMAVNPALGVGPGNYHPYVYYHNTLWFGRNTYTTAHSNYVQMASELGLIGLAVFLWVIASGIMTGHRATKRGPPELRWLTIAATAIFVSMAVASVLGDYLFPSRGNNGIINFGTTVYTWLIMGAAVAAMNLPSKTEPEVSH